MIVFTLTNRNTGNIYVGSTRSVPEERWEQLAEMAADGAEGKLLDDIRTHGEDAFKIEEWGVAESPAGIRELIQEAQEQLGAQPIRTKSPSNRERAAEEPSLGDIRRMLEEIRDNDPVIDEPAAELKSKADISTQTRPNEKKNIRQKQPALTTGRRSCRLYRKRAAYQGSTAEAA
ncbi:hypothetical protein [Solemya velesiana gill symbiont]|uniref:GIY-YIG domain-containing protein n=1 Tax=Solemya velesiana gill symbiont TaxID=1918948 RepID=A0A1T2KSI4_9GAMM|nr:hypothetical protein [Solemya velesiana gill symbiont]OOZ35792.1 hypothetical protein BOW51_10315 [Solemya velesiana gill symbiont]